MSRIGRTLQLLELRQCRGAGRHALADDIAYDAHDIDDGLRADLFRLDELAAVRAAGQDHPATSARCLLRRSMPRAAGARTRAPADRPADRGCRLPRPDGALRALAPRSADDVRHAPSGGRASRRPLPEADGAIKDFLETRMYRHARVMRIMDDAAQVVRELFARYQPARRRAAGGMERGPSDTDEGGGARRIADFIAGMTDRYALAEHARRFDSTPELRRRASGADAAMRKSWPPQNILRRHARPRSSRE